MQNGVVTILSDHTVDETVQRLQASLEAKAIKLFALIDHSGEAEKAGFTMRSTKLLIFGNPVAGTPIMLAAQTSALDLPLKILVWQDSEDKVRVSFNDPEYLAVRHTIPQELVKNISAVKDLAAHAAK